jgi:hypothetical protein
MRFSSFVVALGAVVGAGVNAAPAEVQDKVQEKRSEEYTRREKTDARDAGSTTKYFREFLHVFEVFLWRQG